MSLNINVKMAKVFPRREWSHIRGYLGRAGSFCSLPTNLGTTTFPKVNDDQNDVRNSFLTSP
jgi:hypothetical protein